MPAAWTRTSTSPSRPGRRRDLMNHAIGPPRAWSRIANIGTLGCGRLLTDVIQPRCQPAEFLHAVEPQQRNDDIERTNGSAGTI
jgi:hypothetical protein